MHNEDNITQTATVTVQGAALLAASVQAPLTVNTGQAFAITLSAQNVPVGAENILGATGTPAASAVLGAALQSGPVPASVTLAGNTTQLFDYSVTASGVPGSITFTCSATGTAENSGNTLSAFVSALIVVQNPSSLTAR